MCGIVGIVSQSTLSEKECSILRWLSYFDVSRGIHSTGYFYQEAASGRVSYMKKKGLPWQLWEDDAVREIMDEEGLFNPDTYQFIIGHNRAATRGAVSTKNAHPFMVRHITGVHNGTVLTGLHKLPEHRKYDVDSEAIFAAIADGWSVDDIEKELDLSFTLVWHNSLDNTINLARNEDRPLFIATSHSGTTMLLASEEWMIEQALKLTKSLSLFKKPVSLPAHELWTFNLKEKDFIKSPVKRPFLKRPVVYIRPPGNTGANNYNSAFRNNSHQHQAQGAPHSAKHSLLGDLIGGAGLLDTKHRMSKREFKEWQRKTGSTCSWCGTVVDWADYRKGDLKFLNDYNTPLCALCVVDSAITSMGYLV